MPCAADGSAMRLAVEVADPVGDSDGAYRRTDPRTRPALEVADIVRDFGEAYRRTYAVTPDQAAVLRAITACRTAALGGHLDTCDSCGFSQPSYNSCRNRHCPKCQGAAQAEWIEKRAESILPTGHYHLVFTVPDVL